MRIHTLLILGTLLFTAPLLANETKIYSSYETVRQALLRNAMGDVRKAAKDLATVARAEKQKEVAALATTLSGTADLASARNSFAGLSDAMIRFRASDPDARPVVAYCPMAKKSWLQPERAAIGNPYLDGGMRTCGELVKDHSGR